MILIYKKKRKKMEYIINNLSYLILSYLILYKLNSNSFLRHKTDNSNSRNYSYKSNRVHRILHIKYMFIIFQKSQLFPQNLIFALLNKFLYNLLFLFLFLFLTILLLLWFFFNLFFLVLQKLLFFLILGFLFFLINRLDGG